MKDVFKEIKIRENFYGLIKMEFISKFHLFLLFHHKSIIIIFTKIFEMVKSNLIVLFILLAIAGMAQERYRSESFDSIIRETYTYSIKEGEDLELDLYMPEYDPEIKRPLILYVHGGSFSQGQRDNRRIQEFCNKMARYGYVVTSISYRLTRKGEPTGFGCNCPANDKLNTFYSAVEDVQDATFFLIENREQFGIDPHKIILAGSSAGAEAVLNTAYNPPNCYGLDSGPVSYAGVIGMAGAIPDTIAIYDESAIPSLLFHGTDDKLVPYGTAPHHYCDKGNPGYLILHGSGTIAQKLDIVNIPYWLHTTCGGGHELAMKPLDEFFDEIIEFCYSFIIKNEGDQRHTIIKGIQNEENFESFSFCSE